MALGDFWTDPNDTGDTALAGLPALTPNTPTSAPPQDQGALASLLMQLPKPNIPAYTPATLPAMTLGQRLLTSFAPEAGGLPGNKNFGEGLLSGIVGGLGTQGAQIQSARDQFNARQQQRAAAVDEERRKATETYNSKLEETGGKILEEQAKPKTGKSFDWMTATPAERAEYLQGVRATAGAKAEAEQGGADTLWSPDVVKARVAMFRAGGPEPSYGFGKTGQPNRTAFNTELAKEMKAEGATGADVITWRTRQAADKAALTLLQKTASSIKASEATVNANADILLGTLDKIPDTGIPLLNAMVRPGAEKFVGSADVTKFNTALGTVQKEFNRILNTGGIAGGGALTNEQAADLRATLGNDFTRKQLRSALQILKLDAGNRTRSLQNEIDATTARMSHIGQVQPAGGGNQKRYTMDAQGNLIDDSGAIVAGK